MRAKQRVRSAECPMQMQESPVVLYARAAISVAMDLTPAYWSETNRLVPASRSSICEMKLVFDPSPRCQTFYVVTELRKRGWQMDFERKRSKPGSVAQRYDLNHPHDHTVA